MLDHRDPVIVLTITAGLMAVTDMYVNFPPSLADLRAMNPGEDTGRQQLLDKDILIGGTVLVAGAYASFMTKSWLPIAGLFLVFAFNMHWHHKVLDGEVFK